MGLGEGCTHPAPHQLQAAGCLRPRHLWRHNRRQKGETDLKRCVMASAAQQGLDAPAPMVPHPCIFAALCVCRKSLVRFGWNLCVNLYYSR